ncbi:MULTISPECIES: capping complex subunit for YIEGIA [Limnochorda]|uniref:capping complex subunit for YIEGIA n=1 Tax=Limnochorda TaxID=1676651 RepID=UPI0017D3F6A6|nr:hypothetical protein [Limnochorda pilosa]MBO2485988.1 hypothetical protein [Bacillota bacterium]MBO2518846.1 hypothetical protein [Bacillota bacterium]NMA71174.1 hypothetical protein [Bacillota bacterium]
MNRSQNGVDIVAVITTNPDRAQGGGATVLIARDRADMEQIAFRTAKLVKGMVHELAEDLWIVAVH